MWPFSRARRRAPEHPYALSRTVLTLSNGLDLTLSDFSRGVLITGGIGSGKTSGPADACLSALLRLGAGGCVLTAKPGDAARVMRLCWQAHRSDDVILFSPSEHWHFDFLQWAMQERAGATAENAVQLLDLLVDITVRQKGKDSDGAYWQEITSKAIKFALMSLQLAKGPCSVEALYRLVTEAPGGFCQMVMEEAKLHGNPHDATLVRNFWLHEFVHLSDKTRSIVLSMLTNTLSPFMPWKIKTLVASGASNVTPADVLAGKIVIVDLPPLVWHLTGQLVQAVWKVCVQREALRRDTSGNPRPVFVFADECQYHALPESDVMVQTVARESRLININIVQNLPVLTHAFGGADRRAAVEAWCGNLAAKFLCANSDNDTNEYFSRLFGHERKLFFSGGTDARGYDVVQDAVGLYQAQGSVHFNEQWHESVPPHKFGQLKTGGFDNDRIVECYLHLAGRRLDGNKPFVKVRFRQE